ncbi:MAG TPA: beta-hexosaminidase, partial [Novosphingobium sp.]|nr:beta-hexosaminidase [Novosphingobium sp.]
LALNCWAKMDDMVGIARELPAMTDAAAARLDRALASFGDLRDEATDDHARLIARRDALLALQAA